MNLSGGQKQRLFIALALINDPELVFLDELTTGLDPQSRRAIWDLVRGIRERGKTVFLTTHLMEEAERLCDRVAIIEHGRIIDIDRPANLVNRHCPERTIVLSTDDRTAEERFRAVPRVDEVIRGDSQYTIRARGAQPLTTAVLVRLRAAQCVVKSVSLVREGGLPQRLRAAPLRPYTILTAQVLTKLLLTVATLALTVLAGKRYYPVGVRAPVFVFTI